MNSSTTIKYIDFIINKLVKKKKYSGPDKSTVEL